MALSTSEISVPIEIIDHKTHLNIDEIQKDFPLLQQTVYGKPLIYLDNAATTQKPDVVIRAIDKYYRQENANIHRGVYYLSEHATDMYENSREIVKNFINASSRREIVFVRGATEGINLVANSYGKPNINEGDEIIISHMEHHSNIVPWQLLCQEKGAKLKVIPINDQGELLIDEFEKLLNNKTKLVSIVYISNSLGTINPVEKIIELSHARNIPVLIDGAQAVQHLKVDVQSLDCDFFVFSGHKIFGPTGIGVLYAKESFLEKMPPYQGGGDMIRSVKFEKTIFDDIPHKFEAGTPNIAGVVGLGMALNYMMGFKIEDIIDHENRLLEHATNVLSTIDGLRIIGTARNKAGVISFLIEGIHPHDIGTIVDRQGIAIRTGHHCTQPVMDRFKVPATCRASFALYNKKEEFDALVDALKKVKKVFS
jgi:cysteine desulfurase/selenocysteine lyase